MKEKVPDVVFFSETKCRHDKVERIRYRLDFDYNFVVDYIGKSGGLAIL